MLKYMIHTCNKRKDYVQNYLIPSLLLQGIELDNIILWLDENNQGCLESCMKAFDSLPKEGMTWHLQDDVVISSNFKEITQQSQNLAPVVCGYCYSRIPSQATGLTLPAYMWYSFPCIKISNYLAKECAKWFYLKAKKKVEYKRYINDKKYDDTIFKEFLLNNYSDYYLVYNLKPNIVDHVDYLIGGSIVNQNRKEKITPAAFFEEPERVEELKDKLEKKELRVAAYCGTRNLYKDMVTAVKSLLINSNVDKVYLLIEDDEFPYELPAAVETINVGNQGYFKKGGPNMGSRFTYMAMMRATLPFIFPQYDKILSLDIDTIVDQDISEIWDIDLGDNYFAACVEPDRCYGGKYYKNGDCRTYYNAGVVMYNLKQLRNRKGMEVIKSLNEVEYPFLEQDCMSKLCEGLILPLDNSYNCTNYSDYMICGRCYNPKIYHYAAIKNWQNYPEVIKYKDMTFEEK